MLPGLLSLVTGTVGKLTGSLLASPLRWLLLLALLVIAAQALQAGRLKLQLAEAREQRALVIAAAFEQAQRATQDARAREASLRGEIATLTQQHQEALSHAQERAAALSDDLRRGAVRVRRELCEPAPTAADRVHPPGPAGARVLADAGAGLREHPAAAAVGTGARADAQVRALQALALSYRKACNG